jgi:A nuclease family of the HNH/ENDO VII superfamily with conserved AHH
LGAKSFAENIQSGNYLGAAVDALGVGFDFGAALIPGAPGFAGIGIALVRSGNSPLKNAMIAAGSRFHKNHDAHHIVAEGLTDQFSVRSRALLERHNIGINEAVNGAVVRRDYHQSGLHNPSSTQAVFERLQAASKGGEAALRKELGAMKKELQRASRQFGCTGTRRRNAC